MVVEVGESTGLKDSKLATIKTIVHKDNNGALTRAKMEPDRNTLTSKLFHIKYHWFREQLKPKEICVMKVGTNGQLGNIFTKVLCLIMFAILLCKFMGW
jgi:hypothetical protein